MCEYTSRTNGSYVRAQLSAVQWCYHDADPDFGQLQARSLTLQLRQRLTDAGVSVAHHPAKGLVEVRLSGVNKGAAADVLLMAADRQAPVDFLLCIGDDDDDEYMLSATTARACSPGLRERLQGKLFTVTVGGTSRPTSHAQYVASSSSQVISLLEALRNVSTSPAMPSPASAPRPFVRQTGTGMSAGMSAGHSPTPASPYMGGGHVAGGPLAGGLAGVSPHVAGMLPDAPLDLPSSMAAGGFGRSGRSASVL
jgi:hypothetical protein